MAIGAGAVRAGRAFVEIFADSTKLAAGLKSVDAQMNKVGGWIGSAGGQLAGMGTAVAAGVASAVGSIGVVFAGFDSKMAEVAAVSGTTGAALDTLRDKAKELGATTKFSATQAADAMKFLGMAGMNDTQILSAIGPVLNVAAAGMMDLARASDIVSDATTAFGLSAEETGRVADVMAKTATSSNTSIEQLGQAFVYAAAQGKAAGQTVEDISAALGILGNSGLKASIAGSGVQGMFKRMVSPKSAQAFRDLGISVADASGKMKPLTRIVDELRTATEGMTQIQRLTAFEKLFGLHAKTAVILTDNADALRKMTGELNNADGAAQKMADVMSGSLLGSWLSFRSSVEGVVLALGEALSGPMTAVLGAATSMARAIAKVVDTNRGLVTGIGAAIIVVGGLGAAVAVVGGGLMFLGAAVSLIGTAVGALGVVVSAVAAPLAGVTAIGVAGFAAVGAAIATVIYHSGLLVPAIKFIGDAFGRLWAIASATMGGIFNALKGGQWGKAAEIAWAGVKLASLKGAQYVLLAIEGLWNNAGKISYQFFGGLLKTLWNVFTSIPKLLWTALKGGASVSQIMADALGGALTNNLDLASKLQPSIDAAKADLVRLNNSVAPARSGGQGQRPQMQMPGAIAQQMQRQQMQNMVPPQMQQRFANAIPQAAAMATPAMGGGAVGGGAMKQTAGNELGQLVQIATGQLIALRRLVELGALD